MTFSRAALATAACFALILAGGLCADLLPLRWAGNWTEHVVRLQAHFVDRFFPFDAVWYQRIATDAYVWDPGHPGVQQDVAFFPLWPLVLRLVSAVCGTTQATRWMTVGLAALFAGASIVAFGQLAHTMLPRPAATRATWFFALWPGASFLLLSYPTGLMNLLCVLAMLAVQQRRFWAGAVCAGLLTAIGPLGLGTAMAVWVCAVAECRQRHTLAAQVPRLLALGLLSISGVFGFLAYQVWKFNDAFAFIKAQGAWAPPPSWLVRVPRAVVHVLILPDFGLGLAYAVHALHARTLVGLQAEFEKGLHTAALGLALLMLLACWRVVPPVMRLQGAFTLALFIWFHSTARPGNSTLRLTYCVITTFIGLGWVLRDRPKLATWMIATSATLLFCAAFLSAAGYHVT